MPASHSYRDLLETNHWIRKNSDKFYWQCTTRTVQESKLFPVNPYIAMSYLNAWYRGRSSCARSTPPCPPRRSATAHARSART